jgi:hypothetical protein
MLHMLATFAEYERELIVECVNAGIAASEQNVTRFGRPAVNQKVSAHKLAIAAGARTRDARQRMHPSRGLELRDSTPAPTPTPTSPGGQRYATMTPTPFPAEEARTMTTAVPLPRIGAPATRALAQHGVLTMDDLKGADLNELSNLHGVGPKTIKLLQAAMGEQQAP